MNTAPLNIYIACLASYNAGRLHGAWVDISGMNADEIETAAQAVIDSSPTEGAEEWAVHDYGGLPSSLGEDPGAELLAQVAELVDERGESFLMALSHECGNVQYADELSENYLGEYSSFREYSDDYAEECVIGGNDNETLARYFDYAAFARDLEMDHTIISSGSGTVYIYQN